MDIDMNTNMADAETLIGRDRHLARILEIVKSKLRDCRCRVFLFGSRAKGKENHASDYDIAVESGEAIDAALDRVREALDDSTIPYFVDVVHLERVDERFREIIENQAVLLWTN